jgi:DNA-binding NarL/FixJ family response regulator
MISTRDGWTAVCTLRHELAEPVLFAERIRVLVLHDDPVARAGLSVAFGRYADFEVQDLPSPQTGMPAPLLFHAQSTADVVVADYKNGVALAARAGRDGHLAAWPKVVVVAGIDREWEIRSALEEGVRGYLLVGCALDELAAGVRAVHAGARYLSPQVAARLADSLAIEPLTAREEEVLQLVVEGLCNKAIGKQLGIAVGTVKSHLKSTFDKLDVDSRTQAVAAVERRGLLRQSQRSGHAQSPSSAGLIAAPRPGARNAGFMPDKACGAKF